MEARRPGEDPRKEARAMSHEIVDKQQRYKQVMDCLTERGPSTAKEVAVWMCLSGFVPTSERNWAAPRLTELCSKGKVEPIGKKNCAYTGRTVTVFSIREGR